MNGYWEYLAGGTGPNYNYYYQAPPGTMFFRSKAKDYALNIENPLPVDGDTFTNVYAWQLSGSVQDNRGYPIPQATAQTEPVFVDQNDADLVGQFHRYAPAQQVSVNVGAAGYAPLPATNLYSWEDMEHAFFLPPQDNLIQNGDFELGMASWTTAGTMPPFAEPLLYFTGARSAAFRHYLTSQLETPFGSEPTDNRQETDLNFAEQNAPLAATSYLSQVVSIPADMHQPTLSFVFHEFTSSTSVFSVKVNGKPLEIHGDGAVPWRHYWADMTPWLGQTVEILFAGESIQEGIYTSGSLDDISLGSWVTPLVTAVTPAQVNGPLPETITISGDNFLATPTVRLNDFTISDVTRVDEHTLLVTLPSNSPAGLLNVWVINPGGQAGVKPYGLRIGKTVFMPMLRR